MNLTVDFKKKKGKIKPLHAVGQPPFRGIDFSMFSYLTKAGIPYSRLHDVGGAYGGGRWVDIPNIFRDFDKDPTLPESYDFAFTDLLIKALVENGVEPYFRLGVTIENYAKVRAYNIYPPKDYKKWAVICEHIIRHYTEGWADGYEYKIKYWEIWNEPDNYEDPMENQMWRGTKEEYYELYGIASKHLKKCFPHLMIGGYGSCGFYALSGNFVKEAASSPRFDYFITFLDGFLDYIKKNECPLDFFSWHSYDNPTNNTDYAKYAKKRLDECGINAEIHLNEWNTEMSKSGSVHHAAAVCNELIAFQGLPIDVACFYDAQLGVGPFASMFNPIKKEPYAAYYAFRAFGELYLLGTEVECAMDGEGLYALAATNEEEGRVLISNSTDRDISLSLLTDFNITQVLVTNESGCEIELSGLDCMEANSIALVYTKK